MLSPSVALLVACRLPDPYAWGESGARIAVDRPDISFPTVDVGQDGPVVQRLTVKNVGTDPLTVRAVAFEAGTDFYTVAPITGPLDPGRTFTYDVAFDPRTAHGHDDVLVIQSDDPERPIVEVPLHGFGLAPVLEVDPAELDFGVISVGCDVARGIVIANDGNDLLIVQVPSFEATSSELAIDGSDYPLEVGPGDVAIVGIAYRPLDEESDAGEVTFVSNDPLTPLHVVAVTADARLADTQLDSFVQPTLFALSKDPVEDTIVVEVDGTVWGGWTYTGHADDGGTNEVRFDGAPAPPAGSAVDISYVVAGPCD